MPTHIEEDPESDQIWSWSWTKQDDWSKGNLGVPIMAQQKWIWLASMRMQFWLLAWLSGLGILHCCGFWCRPAATAPIGPLAWEPPYAMGSALKRPKKKRGNPEELPPKHMSLSPNKHFTCFATFHLFAEFSLQSKPKSRAPCLLASPCGLVVRIQHSHHRGHLKVTQD